jgi:catechol 2,3-dioxygenase-like lactoylglutathione lyase family enzyme
VVLTFVGRHLPEEAMQMKLELVSVPVSDVDRAKDFYTTRLGFHADIDQTISDGRRFCQLTPPGSACSIAIGKGITDMAPGSMKALLLLVVSDIQRAWEDLTGKGVEVTRPQKQPWGAIHAEFADPDGNRWTLQQPRPAVP